MHKAKKSKIVMKCAHCKKQANRIVNGRPVCDKCRYKEEAPPNFDIYAGF